MRAKRIFGESCLLPTVFSNTIYKLRIPKNSKCKCSIAMIQKEVYIMGDVDRLYHPSTPSDVSTSLLISMSARYMKTKYCSLRHYR